MKRGPQIHFPFLRGAPPGVLPANWAEGRGAESARPTWPTHGQGLDHMIASGGDPEPDAVLKHCAWSWSVLLPSVKTSREDGGQPMAEWSFFLFLLFPYFSLFRGSVTLSLSYRGTPGRKSGCRITRPQWKWSDFCNSFLISGLCPTASSTSANTLWLQRLRAVFEGTRLLPADPGGPRWHRTVEVEVGEGCARDPTFPRL